MQARVIDGFEVALFEDSPEPYILDVELGRRLQFKRPRVIRELIGRWYRAGMLSDTRCVQPKDGAPYGTARHCGAREDVPGSYNRGNAIPKTQYFLGEADALFIITKADTPVSNQITKQIIQVFMAWRRGQLTQPKTDPAIAQALTALHEEVKAIRVLSTHIAQAVGVPLPKRIAQDARGRNRSRSSLEKYPGIQLHIEHLFGTAKTYDEIIQSVWDLFHYRITKSSLSRAYQRWAIRTSRSASRLSLLPI